MGLFYIADGIMQQAGSILYSSCIAVEQLITLKPDKSGITVEKTCCRLPCCAYVERSTSECVLRRLPLNAVKYKPICNVMSFRFIYLSVRARSWCFSCTLKTYASLWLTL